MTHGRGKSASVFEGENPELFKRFRNETSRGVGKYRTYRKGQDLRDRILNHKLGGNDAYETVDTRTGVKGVTRKTSAGRANELRLRGGQSERLMDQAFKPRMTGAEYHAKHNAELAAKKAAEEAAKQETGKVAETIAKESTKVSGKPKNITAPKVLKSKKSFGELRQLVNAKKAAKLSGKIALGTVGVAGAAYGGKKIYDHYKNKEK